MRCSCRPQAPAKKKQNQKQNPKQNQRGQAPPQVQSAEEMRALRISKAATLREQGMNPYAYTFPRTHMAAALQAKYADIPNGEEADAEVVVAVAGRVMARRVMGKLAFVSLVDDSGSIQLYVDKSRLEEGADAFKRLKNLIDVGDIIGVTGGLRRTDKGELSVVAHKMEVRQSLPGCCQPVSTCDKWLAPYSRAQQCETLGLRVEQLHVPPDPSAPR